MHEAHYDTAQDPLTHKVVMHFYVLRASMEFGVLGELHATDVVTVDWDRIGNLTCKSCNSRLSHMASHVATMAPLYSASVLDKATVGWFLLLQAIAALPWENIKPDVDR